ncbi:MAG TPA: hypothetical protein VKD72_03660, partial [Gemmataceae bacterium]|nr:hypothetical protein [Gemmataceae bacterium]
MRYTMRTGWALVTAVFFSSVPAGQAQRTMPNRTMPNRMTTPLMRPGMPGMNAHQPTANAAVSGHVPMLNPFGFGNPYAGFSIFPGGMVPSSRGFSGYMGGMSMSYGSGGYGGYGGGSARSSNGTSSASGNPYQSENSMAGATLSSLQTARLTSSNVLDAMGLPNGGGRLDWPLGLRILPPGEKTVVLRNQIDALLGMAARQSAQGPVSPKLLQEASQAVNELHSLLREKRLAFEA